MPFLPKRMALARGDCSSEGELDDGQAILLAWIHVINASLLFERVLDCVVCGERVTRHTRTAWRCCCFWVPLHRRRWRIVVLSFVASYIRPESGASVGHSCSYH